MPQQQNKKRPPPEDRTEGERSVYITFGMSVLAALIQRVMDTSPPVVELALGVLAVTLLELMFWPHQKP